MAEAFAQVKVLPLFPVGTNISWVLDCQMSKKLTPDWSYSVEFSRSGVASASDWAFIAGASWEADSVTDYIQHNWGQNTNGYYRVNLLGPGSPTPPVWSSLVTPAFGVWKRYDYLLAREIARKEFLNFNKGQGGVCGYLFRRRNWGVPCSFEGCYDPDTQEARNPNCPVCFGTSFIGGYHTPAQFCMSLSPLQTNEDTQTMAGTSNVETVVGRAVAFPLPRTKDFWADTNTGRRYYVGNVSEGATIRQVPLVLNVTLGLAPVTDVIYNVPLP